MKAVLPLTLLEEGLWGVSPDFRGSQHVGLFDSITGDFKPIRADDLVQGHATLVSALKARGATAVVAGCLFPLAMKALMEGGMTCYAAQGNDLQGNLAKFTRGELKLTNPEIEGQGCSPSSCSSCSSTACGGAS